MIRNLSEIQNHSKHLFIESLRRLKRGNSMRGVLLFPFVIGIITTVITYSLESLLLFNINSILFVISIFFCSIGLQIGLIFLVDVELINDFAADETLLHYVAKFEPISRSGSFISFFITETVTYVLLFVFPVSVGTILGTSVSFTSAPVLISSYIVSFLFGITALFIISSYRKLFTVPIVAFGSVLLSVGISEGASVSLLNSTPIGSIFVKPPFSYGILGAWATVCLIGIVVGFINQSKLVDSKEQNSSNNQALLSRLMRRAPSHNRADGKLSVTVTKILIAIFRASSGINQVIGVSVVLWAVSLGLIQSLGNLFVGTTYYLVSVSVLIPGFSYMFYHLIISNSPFSDYKRAPISARTFISAEAYVFYLLAFISWVISVLATVLTKNVSAVELILSILLSTGMYISIYWFTVTICKHDTEELFNGKKFIAYGFVLNILIIPPILLSTIRVIQTPITLIMLAFIYIGAGKFLKYNYLTTYLNDQQY